MCTYTAKITWKSDSAEAFEKNRYARGHTWKFDGGVSVPASSSPHSVRVPYSVEAAVDPEASRQGFNVESYEDNAVGEMTTSDAGKQWISKITLNPQITWTGAKIPTAEELAHMHLEAHEVCYVENSIKSEVVFRGSE